jgi:hypothetical protein
MSRLNDSHPKGFFQLTLPSHVSMRQSPWATPGKADGCYCVTLNADSIMDRYAGLEVDTSVG